MSALKMVFLKAKSEQTTLTIIQSATWEHRNTDHADTDQERQLMLISTRRKQCACVWVVGVGDWSLAPFK